MIYQNTCLGRSKKKLLSCPDILSNILRIFIGSNFFGEDGKILHLNGVILEIFTEYKMK